MLTRDCTVCEWTDSQIFFGQNYPSTNEFVYHLPNGLVSSGDDCVLEGEGRDKRNCVYFLYIIIMYNNCVRINGEAADLAIQERINAQTGGY